MINKNSDEYTTVLSDINLEGIITGVDRTDEVVEAGIIRVTDDRGMWEPYGRGKEHWGVFTHPVKAPLTRITIQNTRGIYQIKFPYGFSSLEMSGLRGEKATLECQKMIDTFEEPVWKLRCLLRIPLPWEIKCDLQYVSCISSEYFLLENESQSGG